jgi:glycosyltransferase involved in cell wall biosynthesis
VPINLEQFSKTDSVESDRGPTARGSSFAPAGIQPARSAQRGDLPILVHCHLRWDFVWQRPQQIFSRLAAHHPILFLEEPLLEEREPHLRISAPYPNIVRVVPVLPSALAGVDAQAEAILAMLRRALAHPPLVGKFANPIQWFYSPMPAPRLLGEFGAVSVVYDCMDELANFRFAPPDISARERFLLARADVVFTGGYQLFRSKSRHHKNVHFFGCGVDVGHFGEARSADTQLPAEVAHLPRPVFGYFGVIDERIDYDLLAQLAESFPDASVVMIGPLAKVERSVLPSRKNIHWLGQRPYEDLPAYLKAFDVCLMPFALNEATQYINPTKTLEYMAAGKPIVSTPVPDVVHNFTPVVHLAASAGEFVEAANRAFVSPDASRIEAGLSRAQAASWDAVVSAMRSHVLEAISGSAKPAPDSRPGVFP